MFSKEIQEEIYDLFKINPEFTDRLLNADVSAIQELTKHNSVDPKRIIDAVDSNNISELYTEAVFKKRRMELYFKMIKEYSENMSNSINSKK